jgi:hypothetical protein
MVEGESFSAASAMRAVIGAMVCSASFIKAELAPENWTGG